jgi:uncharacterized protein
MNPHVSVITLGVRDMSRAKQFYGDGLGWPIQQEYPEWVTCSLGNGSSSLGLSPVTGVTRAVGVACYAVGVAQRDTGAKVPVWRSQGADHG